MALLACAGTAAYLLAQAALGAEDFEQHSAHEHGRISINVAVEGQNLSIELEIPAVNVVGFEHAPRTEREKTQAAQAAALLTSGVGLFGVPAEARCRLTEKQVTTPQWGEAGAARDTSADAHDHDHEHDEHADYDARLTYLCEAPEKLQWIEPWVIGKLHDVHEARVNVITPDRQRSQNVRDAKERVSLRGGGA